MQLKRAVEFRDDALDQLYDFEGIPGVAGRKSYQVMSDLGLIKPLMKKELTDLRNALLHEGDDLIPDVDACRRLSEFAWYYLKSTDYLAAAVTEVLFSNDLQELEPDCWLEVGLERNDAVFTVGGCLPNAMTATAPRPGLLPLIGTCEFPEAGICSIKGKLALDPPDTFRLVKIFLNEFE